ncbi:MAG TPA: DUF393 domain-containing protein [Nitrospira sp.]|nr:DUF393 domain-containing protein [Nitrospira sp.]
MSDPTKQPTKQPPRGGSADCTLVYDGHCRLCVSAKTQLERLGAERPGGALRMVPYDDEEAKRLLREAYRPGRPDVAFLIDSEGKITKGLDAFLPLLPTMKGGTLLAGLFRLPLVKPFARLLYRVVAKHRYRLFGEVRPPHGQSSHL